MSFLIKVLYQILARICEKGSNTEELAVLVTAQIGKATHAVHEITAHIAFSSLLSPSSNKMTELSADLANTISSHFMNVKAVIIDRILMLGAQQFYSIHRRLQ